MYGAAAPAMTYAEPTGFEAAPTVTYGAPTATYAQPMATVGQFAAPAYNLPSMPSYVVPAQAPLAASMAGMPQASMVAPQTFAEPTAQAPFVPTEPAAMPTANAPEYPPAAQ